MGTGLVVSQRRSSHRVATRAQDTAEPNVPNHPGAPAGSPLHLRQSLPAPVTRPDSSNVLVASSTPTTPAPVTANPVANEVRQDSLVALAVEPGTQIMAAPAFSEGATLQRAAGVREESSLATEVDESATEPSAPEAEEEPPFPVPHLVAEPIEAMFSAAPTLPLVLPPKPVPSGGEPEPFPTPPSNATTQAGRS